jgi:N6-L-threonylcarbamoyladenine synthase
MKILSIETSCDETSIALIEKIAEGKYKVLSHETISQINFHREYGGVYPALSRREHEKNLVPLLHKVLADSHLLIANETSKDNLIEILGSDIELIERYPDLKENVFDLFSKFKIESIDYIAVTNGPGLPPALWVGVNFAKVLSILMNSTPIYPINHMEGHIIGAISNRVENEVEIKKINYPAICLLISGGHTEIVLSTKPGEYKKIGETQDDAVGEAYDKVARLLSLPYPGGPEIGRLAEIGRKGDTSGLKFPRPMMHTKDLNFSFSGLKTHILYFIRDFKKELDNDIKTQIATEFEESVKDVLIHKVKKAIEETGANTLVVGGGVASNGYLRENFEKLSADLGVDLFISSKELSTDNALMIALCAANQIENGVSPTENFIAVGSKKYQW